MYQINIKKKPSIQNYSMTEGIHTLMEDIAAEESLGNRVLNSTKGLPKSSKTQLNIYIYVYI